MKVAESQRICLEEFSLADVNGFYQLNQDPIVLQYTGDCAFQSKQETAKFIQDYDHYQKHGYGRWSIYLKTTSDYIGFCGLRYSPKSAEVDIGFRILRSHWGRGYATEAADLTLQIGFNQYKLNSIVGRAMKNNLASHRVLKKLNFKLENEFLEAGETWWLYRSRNKISSKLEI